jgi:hypothetical protein
MFIDIELESVLGYLNKLDAAAKPAWGSMGAQRMVEHLTDTLRIATGKNPQKQIIPFPGFRQTYGSRNCRRFCYTRNETST